MNQRVDVCVSKGPLLYFELDPELKSSLFCSICYDGFVVHRVTILDGAVKREPVEDGGREACNALQVVLHHGGPIAA